MKRIILLLLLKIIYNDDYQNITDYWFCELKDGCKGLYFTLIGCKEEFYSFKLNTTKCEELNGEIDFYYCDNYIEEDQEFTLEACSPSELRGCSNIPCFNGKGMIRNILDCKVDGGDFSHIKHIYYPHYQKNYYNIKQYINFGIPQQLSIYDNGETVCSFETQKDLIDYLVWTVKDKFVYTYGGGHASDYYGKPSKGTPEKCPNDVNVIGFDSSGLVLYMLKMLGNRVNLGGSDCQKLYEIGKRLGIDKLDGSIKPGDVLLFGNDEYKSHAAIAISRTEALEAYRHYEDENCTGMPILTRPIDEIRRLYKNGKVYIVDFLQKKTFIDGEKYLKDENVYEPNPIVIKSIFEFHQVEESFYILVNSIVKGEERKFSFVIYISFSNNKKLRNLDENLKIKFYCDFNSSEKNENISELILINYNCSTDPYDNLNLTEEDNLIESVELENKDEEKYFDINNVNKTMNISQISKNESDFSLDNLANYIIFTFYENKTINLTNETSFILEGQTNYELSENISIKLSFNNTKDFHMNCVIFSKHMDNSSLYCSFNDSNLKANNNINIYSIKENEISSNDNNIFFVGLKNIEFIYEKEEEENKINIKEILIIFIKPIIIIASIIIVVIIIIVILYFIFMRKTKETLKPKNKEVNIKQSKESSRNKIIDNGCDQNTFNKLKAKNNQ